MTAAGSAITAAKMLWKASYSPRQLQDALSRPSLPSSWWLTRRHPGATLSFCCTAYASCEGSRPGSALSPASKRGRFPAARCQWPKGNVDGNGGETTSNDNAASQSEGGTPGLHSRKQAPIGKKNAPSLFRESITNTQATPERVERGKDAEPRRSVAAAFGNWGSTGI
jgi:hypothetical protein